VPDVVTLTQAAAATAITDAGLVVGTATNASSATVPSGSVISSNPGAGTQVAAGSAVNLVVSTGPAVPVPNVVNETQAAAMTAITGAGLVVGTVTNASSATVPSGSVISSNPAAGTQVAAGSAVNLVVSTGPAPIAVPNVVNQTQAAATTAITGAGLVVGTVTNVSSATVPSGSVISSNPGAGTQVAPGSAVDLFVSTGPVLVAVPNVVNQTQAAASTAITGAGLVVGTVTNASSATVPSGSVISSNPGAGTQAAAGSAVNLVVSTGPATPVSLWSSSTIPSATALSDTSSVELGVKFRSDVAGTVRGVRFYKHSTNTGTHTGTLWSSTGTKLATATFTGETASGWQQVTFPTPVAIAANTTYVVSYHTNVGRYSYNSAYFASSGVDNGPLHALAGANGVYRYGTISAFPTSSFNSTNYWVDVVFVRP
jgi:beta-lactam-binding protein with PASTA domain